MNEPKTYHAKTEDGTRIDVTITPPDEKQLIMEYAGTLTDHDELRKLQRPGRQRLPDHKLRKEANMVAPSSVSSAGDLRWDHTGQVRHGQLRLESLGGHPAMGDESIYFRANKKYEVVLTACFEAIGPHWVNFFQLYGINGEDESGISSREQLALFANLDRGDLRYSLLARDRFGTYHSRDLGKIDIGVYDTFILTFTAGLGPQCGARCARYAGSGEVTTASYDGDVGTGQMMLGPNNYLVQSFGPYSSHPVKCWFNGIRYYHFERSDD